MVYGRMRWYKTFFVHWKVTAAQLLPHIPPGLDLDLFKDDAYVSMVALRVSGPAPWLLMPLSERFFRYNQLNVRTYVISGSGRGILLIDTLVDRLLPAFGARLLGMPYRVVRDIDFKVNSGRVILHAPGLDIEGSISDAAPTTAEAGSLVEFLTDRFLVYSRMPGGLTYGLRIEHGPWRMRPVSLAEAPMLPAADIVGAEPVAAHLAEELDVSLVGATVVTGSTATRLTQKRKFH